MFLEQVVTKPDPYAPFLLSQAIKANGFVFVSGQAAIGDNGEIVGEGEFDRQAEQVFGNLDRALKAAGSGLDKVVKVTIFLRSMENFAKIVELRRKWFSAPYPADSIIEVSSLYSPKAMIEIEAIALNGSH
ncbi:RidA family protein (plasmid) [Sinorhizobium meliloti]|uniref:RidA family protein n=1 Tax=Rhizobium meliloti TaxID=382 RepID=UPI000FD6E43E|nr:RidA family protein [Sinorhizobium meliloti]MDW9816812.1 RidA family protein [Sinorhizobium meliloti]MDX0261238.1 RidA family protein [Sinorhizobium meliloti]MDX0348598.1 RidA family protein [Sinorhizobium meliloti]QPI27886.1 RidA family protein [Sinorhizobium meliloti]RVK61760.1 RidA family protein [Sinorhizobium meliloti]